MARKKVKLAYIVKNSNRNLVFRKRKTGLIKKVKEISILCGVEACAIIYKQNDSQPEVWPSESEVQQVLHRFETVPKLVQSKHMMDHEGYLKQRIMKAEEHLRKQKDVNKKEMTNLMDQFILAGKIVGNANMANPNDLLSLIDENLKGVEHRIQWMQSQEEVHNIGAHPMNVGNVQGMMIGEQQVNMGHTQGLVSGGELEAYTGHSQGLENNMGLDTNMDAMQVDQDLSTGFTNNTCGVLPFGDVDVPKAFWTNPHFP